MKKIVLILAVALLSLSLPAQNLKASLSYKTYCTSNMEPYIEFTFIVDGKSVVYTQNTNKRYEAEVEIQVVFEKESNKVDTLHYILSSAEYADTSLQNKQDFADIVNFKIPNGSYFLHFTLNDINSSNKPISYIDNIEVYFPENKVSSSGINLLSSLSVATEDDFFTKYGYATPPLLNNYVPASIHFLPVYMEIYNSDNVLGKDNVFIVSSYITKNNKKEALSPEFEYRVNYRTAPLQLFTYQFNVTSLPSGNYDLVVEVLDTDSNVLVSNSTFFQRSNPGLETTPVNINEVLFENSFVQKITDAKTLQDYTASLYPIGTPMEQEFFNKRLSKISHEELQRFFYSFWVERNPDDPEGEWLAYYDKVKYVQAVYGSKIVKGYRTDRGRVYLQYGPPTSIKESPFSSSMHPYEIWNYYYIGGESNIKFVFYNPDLVTNDYQLLHSDKKGEISDPAWQKQLMRGHQPDSNFDEKKPDNFWGNDMDENWRNP